MDWRDMVEILGGVIAITATAGAAILWILRKRFSEEFVLKPDEADGPIITRKDLMEHCNTQRAMCQANFCNKIEEVKRGMAENRKTVIRSYTELTRKYERGIAELYEENKEDRAETAEALQNIHSQLGHLAGVIEGRGNLAELIKKK